MDVRRIVLTPRPLERPLWWWIPKGARRALTSVAFLIPILAIVVTILPPGANRLAPSDERVVFLAPLREAIQLALAHPGAVVATPTQTPTPAAAAPTAATQPTVTQPAAPAPVVTQAPPAQQANVDTSSAAAWAASAGVACIRQHESGDDYAADTGNGYYGAYQDLLSTWQAAGGTGLPSDAPSAVQDQINYEIWQSGGWGQWSTASLCGL